MSILTPAKIYEDFKNKILDRNQAADLLISLVDDIHNDDDATRILALKFLGLISPNGENVFNFLENLLISDLNENVRGQAASVMIVSFSEKAIKPISWVLKYEKNLFLLAQVIKVLKTNVDDKLNSLLNIVKFVDFEGNIFFPSNDYHIINLNNKNIDDIDKVRNLEKLIELQKLYLNYNQLQEIEGLDTLTNLKSLHLQGNRIKNIKGLSNLKNLEFLYLNNNEISLIEGLNNLTNLKILMLYDNKITEIKKFEKLSNLEVLNLRNNQISEIKGLEKLNNLKKLDLSNNLISEIKGIDNLTKLEFLDLSYNQIKEIKGIKNLKKLKFLDLRNNTITKINQLEKLKNLQFLYLGFNQLSDLKNLDKYRNIKVLDIKNAEEKFIPNSLWDLYRKKMNNSNTLRNKIENIRDIKFIPNNFNSKSIIKDLSFTDDYIKFFSNSSWMFLLKNNEYETFKLSRNGNIEWLQRSRK